MLDWAGKEGPSFRPADDTTASFAVFNLSDISLGGGTARITYDTRVDDVQAIQAEAGIHLVTKPPYRMFQPAFLSVYAYPGPGADSAAFAAVWTGHYDYLGMPMPQILFGSCRPVY